MVGVKTGGSEGWGLVKYSTLSFHVFQIVCHVFINKLKFTILFVSQFLYLFCDNRNKKCKINKL